MLRRYRVHVGYRYSSRSVYRYFFTLQGAKDYCELVFQTRGHFLSIEVC